MKNAIIKKGIREATSTKPKNSISNISINNYLVYVSEKFLPATFPLLSIFLESDRDEVHPLISGDVSHNNFSFLIGFFYLIIPYPKQLIEHKESSLLLP